MKKLCLFLLLLASLCASADDAKLAPELRGLTGSGNITVIVQYSTAPTQNLLQGLLNLTGSILDQLPIVNSLVASLPINQLVNLSGQPDVVYVSPDRPLRMMMDNAAGAVRAQAAWNAKLTGAGIGVAVIDSGIAGSAQPRPATT